MSPIDILILHSATGLVAAFLAGVAITGVAIWDLVSDRDRRIADLTERCKTAEARNRDHVRARTGLPTAQHTIHDIPTGQHLVPGGPVPRPKPARLEAGESVRPFPTSSPVDVHEIPAPDPDSIIRACTPDQLDQPCQRCENGPHPFTCPADCPHLDQPDQDTQEGAGDDGPDRGGDAAPSGDGADGHDVGRTGPEPAPHETGEGVPAALHAGTPEPTPRQQPGEGTADVQPAVPLPVDIYETAIAAGLWATPGDWSRAVLT